MSLNLQRLSKSAPRVNLVEYPPSGGEAVGCRNAHDIVWSAVKAAAEARPRFYANDIKRTSTNKKLPFKSSFKEYTVTDPYQIYEAFDKANTSPEIHTVVVDSLTYLMAMFETVHVVGSTNTMQMWGEYAQFLKRLMSQYVSKTTKNVVFTAHTLDVLNEVEMTMDTLVKVKGSLMNEGVESFFSTIVAAKKIPLKNLTGASSDYLNVTEEEEMLGYKHCFQTRLTKDTVNERIRSSLGMWDVNETYIDNDVQMVIDRLHHYYN